MATFRYFRGPLRHIRFYCTDKRCSICHKVRPATGLGSNRYCCLGCLAEGRVTLNHSTELGYLESGRIMDFDVTTESWAAVDIPDELGPDKLEALSHQPRFNAHQDDIYLVHCNDFMCYIGRWEPEDFVRIAPADPRRAYIEMADSPQLWDDTEREKADYGAKWPAYRVSRWAYGSWCYVFECLHCGKLRCYWDCG